MGLMFVINVNNVCQLILFLKLGKHIEFNKWWEEIISRKVSHFSSRVERILGFKGTLFVSEDKVHVIGSKNTARVPFDVNGIN